MPLNTDHCSLNTSQIGALFDWDGVVIDSAKQHEESWQLLAAELGVPFTRDMFLAGFGKRNVTIIPNLYHWAEPGDHPRIREIGDRKEALYRDFIRREGIDPLPGLRELLTALRDAGVPASVASSTPRENIECVLDITGLHDFFSAITAAEDVSKGKPHPDVFLLAAEKIDRLPENCVVFEDAQYGIDAGNAAGAKTIAVATTHSAVTLRNATLTVPSLTEITLDTLRSLF